MSPLDKLRAIVPTATVTLDAEALCYRATAPRGMRWDSGLHELVSVFGISGIADCCTRQEARQDLADQLREYAAAGSPEICDDMDCDWPGCNGGAL